MYSVILNLRSRTPSFLNALIHIAFEEVHYRGKGARRLIRLGHRVKVDTATGQGQPF